MPTAKPAATGCSAIKLRIPASVVWGQTPVSQMPRSGSHERTSPATATQTKAERGSGRTRASQPKTAVAPIMPTMVTVATDGAVSGEKPAGTPRALRSTIARITFAAVAAAARAAPTTTSRARFGAFDGRTPIVSPRIPVAIYVSSSRLIGTIWHTVPIYAICAVNGLERRIRYTVPMSVAIGERKRRAVRGELSEVALRLLTDRDFNSLTIDEIAAAAGISRRTFFRYFTSKEDVVFAFLDRWAVRLASDIVARPAGEDPVAAVQYSFRQLTAAYDDRALALVRLVRETPSLRAQEHINREHLRIAVVNALAARLGFDAETDMRPQILATIAFAPLDAAMFAWFGSRSDEEVGHLLDEALRTFERERDAMCAGLRLARKPPKRVRPARQQLG